MDGALIEKQPAQSKVRNQRSEHCAYWRSTLLKGIAGVCVILIINFAFLGWVCQKDVEDGVAVIYTGSRKEMGVVFFWTHLAINILSTVLLMVCNACMHCLSAPTRKEIDLAHAKHDWLDIGVTSARNLSRVNVWRGVLWVCLALSSVPLSLFYNSVIFTSPTAIDYLALLVAPEFLDGGAYRSNINADNSVSNSDMDPVIKMLQNNQSSLVHMDIRECGRQYSEPVQTDWSHVLLVSTYHSPNDTVIYVNQQLTGLGQELMSPGWVGNVQHNESFEEPLCNGTIRYNWSSNGGHGLPPTCSADNTMDSTRGLQRRRRESNAPTSTAPKHPPFNYLTSRGGFWTPNPSNESQWPSGTADIFVDYCLALPNPRPLYEVNVSITLLAVVIAFNVVKLLCLLGTLFLPKFEPLVTVGDAIASFLRMADLHTDHQGLLSAADVKSGRWHPISMDTQDMKPRKWIQPPLALCRTVTVYDWMLNSIVVAIVFFAGIAMLPVGSYLGRWDPGVWSEGLGEPNPNEIIPATVGWPLMGTILLANIPQLAISIAYFSYNYVLTTMLMCKEFSRYAAVVQRNVAEESTTISTNDGHPLRVSRPVKDSEQVGNWQLSLPYAYALPLTGVMVLLHWFVSQALFAERIGSYWIDGEMRSYIVGAGWSLKGIIASVVVGGAMIVALVAVAVFGRLKPGVPVVGSCSVALAAACDARSDDDGAELKMVSFGVLEKLNVEGRDLGRVGFGSSRVGALKEGELYI